MLDGHKTHTGKRGNSIKICSNEFYTAIMDEDLRRIEGLSKKYGNKCLIEKQGGASGDVFWKGFTILPLHLAASYRRVHSMQSLLSAGADIEMRDQLGRTPLHLVIIGWPRILTTWPKPDSKFQTAVMGMCRQAEDCVRLLCEHGVNINAEGVQQSGNTPLHLAVIALATKSTKTLEDGISCIIELLESGAEPNAVNKAGTTPLQDACSMGNEELVDLLLRYGANINKLSKAGENCLFLFLNHLPNVRNSSLLLKLLSLTSPLTIYNQNGRLPSTLTQPCFVKQREQLLTVIQQPRRLHDICKSAIFLKHVHGRTEELKRVMPERLYDFVFNHWENTHNISFDTDSEQDVLNHVFDIIPS
ncbi:ankyrin repeat domain-containing protein 61 isoform X2 [Stegastes partitus]|uniref:Ankyrin repeat domain-containing protein 61 isoform X2 n=1 Tax=Stegastes partitus TaxID=144197 RepID=A0A9Y4NR86_9TELE|nr:PREDICTED: ankyrin repeat domain-containing protein 61 isoform X2 [Stegastes partitus]